jgi:DNA-binding NtrC family response regulator
LRHKILIVDDEEGVRFGIRNFLESKGYEMLEAISCAQAQEVFQEERPDAVIADFRLPDGDGLDLLGRLKELDSSVPVLVLTGHASIDLAVRAIKQGAEQFLTKPVELPALLVLLERVLENQRVRQKELAGEAQREQTDVDPFLGASPAIRQLASVAKKVAASESPVLILGETGVGKGILARWLHRHGPRADEAFVDLNCAGLVRDFLETELFGHTKGAFTGAVSSKLGLLEVAHRGTLFLDEIGDVETLVQPKLLKVLEEKQFRRLGDVRDRRVDVRLIAATHQDLQRLVQEKKFRSDLFYRISTVPLVVPPLRQRREDIPLLADVLLKRCATDLKRGQPRLSVEALAAMQAYSWPGNVRELRNVLERATLFCDDGLIRVADLYFHLPVGAHATLDSCNLTLEEFDRQYVERVLDAEHGHVERAAARLGIPRSSLYQKIKRHDIHVATGR